VAGSSSLLLHNKPSPQGSLKISQLRNRPRKDARWGPTSDFAGLPKSRMGSEQGPVTTSRGWDLATLTRISISHNHLSLALPIPPSINQQYATVNGRRVLSSLSRRYKASIAQFVLATLAQFPQRQTLLHSLQTHYLALSIHFFLPSLLKRDLDGGLKIAQDALCQALDINDNRILEIHLYKDIDSSFPRMECTLSTQIRIKHKDPPLRRTQNRFHH